MLACLYVLVPESAQVSIPHFAAAVLAAQLLGIVSQVPGGLGVFEGALLLALNQTQINSAMVASLVAFRLLYYVVPLVLGFAFYAIYEISERHALIAKAKTAALVSFSSIIPTFFSGSVFISGVVLLISGATPSMSSRLQLLERFLPLPIVEVSHVLSSVVGMLLIVLSRGLARRLDLAWVLTTVLLSIGALSCFLRGVDYEEGVALLIQLGFLLPGRSLFFRKSKALGEWTDINPSVLALLLFFGFACTLLVGHFGHFAAAPWQSQDILEFAFHGEANRFLRTSVVLFLLIVTLLLWESLSIARELRHHRTMSRDEALAIVKSYPSTHGWLAFTGDKLFFPSSSGKCFLMYQWVGKSWVAMGDPVGNPDESSELVWSFQEAALRHGCSPAFYQVQLSQAELYVDLGLTLTKLGEEALVPLGDFNLGGTHRKDLRQSLRNAEKLGWSFEIIEADDVPQIFAQLEAVSQAWLQNRKEKSFSLGGFSLAYLKLFPCAVVKNAAGDFLAFANIWTQSSKTEMSIDLMRHIQPCPKGLMDFLFTKLMFEGKAQGYTFFNLGMAPLSGIENRPHAPRWNRLASFIYRHGKRFYNFYGLRSYKQKFQPEWRPLYLAAEGGMGFPRVLLDITLLINRDPKRRQTLLDKGNGT